MNRINLVRAFLASPRGLMIAAMLVVAFCSAIFVSLNNNYGNADLAFAAPVNVNKGACANVGSPCTGGVACVSGTANMTECVNGVWGPAAAHTSCSSVVCPSGTASAVTGVCATLGGDSTGGGVACDNTNFGKYIYNTSNVWTGTVAKAGCASFCDGSQCKIDPVKCPNANGKCDNCAGGYCSGGLCVSKLAAGVACPCAAANAQNPACSLCASGYCGLNKGKIFACLNDNSFSCSGSCTGQGTIGCKYFNGKHCYCSNGQFRQDNDMNAYCTACANNEKKGGVCDVADGYPSGCGTSVAGKACAACKSKWAGANGNCAAKGGQGSDCQFDAAYSEGVTVGATPGDEKNQPLCTDGLVCVVSSNIKKVGDKGTCQKGCAIQRDDNGDGKKEVVNVIKEGDSTCEKYDKNDADAVYTCTSSFGLNSENEYSGDRCVNGNGGEISSGCDAVTGNSLSLIVRDGDYCYAGKCSMTTDTKAVCENADSNEKCAEVEKGIRNAYDEYKKLKLTYENEADIDEDNACGSDLNPGGVYELTAQCKYYNAVDTIFKRNSLFSLDIAFKQNILKSFERLTYKEAPDNLEKFTTNGNNYPYNKAGNSIKEGEVLCAYSSDATGKYGIEFGGKTISKLNVDMNSFCVPSTSSKSIFKGYSYKCSSKVKVKSGTNGFSCNMLGWITGKVSSTSGNVLACDANNDGNNDCDILTGTGCSEDAEKYFKNIKVGNDPNEIPLPWFGYGLGAKGGCTYVSQAYSQGKNAPDATKSKNTYKENWFMAGKCATNDQLGAGRGADDDSSVVTLQLLQNQGLASAMSCTDGTDGADNFKKIWEAKKESYKENPYPVNEIISEELSKWCVENNKGETCNTSANGWKCEKKAEPISGGGVSCNGDNPCVGKGEKCVFDSYKTLTEGGDGECLATGYCAGSSGRYYKIGANICKNNQQTTCEADSSATGGTLSTPVACGDAGCDEAMEKCVGGGDQPEATGNTKCWEGKGVKCTIGNQFNSQCAKNCGGQNWWYCGTAQTGGAANINGFNFNASLSSSTTGICYAGCPLPNSNGSSGFAKQGDKFCDAIAKKAYTCNGMQSGSDSTGGWSNPINCPGGCNTAGTDCNAAGEVTNNGTFDVQCTAAYDAIGATVNCNTGAPLQQCTVTDGNSGLSQNVSGDKNNPKTSFTMKFANAGTGQTTQDSQNTNTNNDVVANYLNQSSGNQSALKFFVSCTSLDGKTDTAEVPCNGTPGAANSYNPASKNNPDNPKSPYNTDNPVNQAPVVTVSGPTGTITAKTAELKASTGNVKSTCVYRDSASSAGTMPMTADSGGTNHTATLNSLDENITNCTAKHDITVTCTNAASTGTTTGQSGLTGSGTTSFTVDLSKNPENAPKVTSRMEDGPQTISNPILLVDTTVEADCQYKEGSDFTYGSGKNFDTTGTFKHNAGLKGLTNNDGKPYTYFVVCKSKKTCATNTPGTEISFKVDLSADPKNQPIITSNTANPLTVANPTLSVITDRPSKCQYKLDATFTYGKTSENGAKQFTNDGPLDHTVSLKDWEDKKYTFYIACMANETSAIKTMTEPIVTVLSRGATTGPVISNTTAPSQTTNTPILSIITSNATNAPLAALCQYKDADFTYGGGTPFPTDGTAGVSGHSVTLPVLSNGQHTFYVACKDPAGATNEKATQIMFTVAAGSTTCASLNSNDRLNDSDRVIENTNDSNSVFIWQDSAENGIRDYFEKITSARYSGYQFSLKKDGQITQLCAYMGPGISYEVSLYGQSYTQLATVNIRNNDSASGCDKISHKDDSTKNSSGNDNRICAGDWHCANITPQNLSKDAKYYVVAYIKNNPAYIEMEADLPAYSDDQNAVVYKGVYQLTGNEKFGKNVVTSDSFIPQMVDAKVRYNSANTNGPTITYSSPTGTVSDSRAKLAAQTNIDADCKFDREDVSWSKMHYTMIKTAPTTFEQLACNLDDGSFTFYVRCKGTTGENNASTIIQFDISR